MKRIALMTALLLPSCDGPPLKYTNGQKVMLKVGVEAVIIYTGVPFSQRDYMVRVLLTDKYGRHHLQEVPVYEYEIEKVIR